MTDSIMTPRPKSFRRANAKRGAGHTIFRNG
jgi:hypothetical protein